ncbi:hypothetical protein RMSM_07474 [Rhodopirellula maiorica SM1]|uniref:Uncharacterized protein n=1 Tax=Rhodopirellula maiorica SM1 TaxID=1265738 RepID=M5RJP1_9BACT|nr:hypothetical protein RMSM_07474 [Rhodopirellula maiorica SM1]
MLSQLKVKLSLELRSAGGVILPDGRGDNGWWCNFVLATVQWGGLLSKTRRNSKFFPSLMFLLFGFPTVFPSFSLASRMAISSHRTFKFIIQRIR